MLKVTQRVCRQVAVQAGLRNLVNYRATTASKHRIFSTCISQRQQDMLNTEGLIFPKSEVSKSEKMKWKSEEHVASSPHSYGTLNFTVQGFDMVVVEKFAQCVHRLMQQHNLLIKEVYALPSEYTSVKHMSAAFNVGNMVAEAELVTYSRIVQVCDLSSTLAPILIQSLVRDIPPGVKFTIHEYNEEDHLKRFKENKELMTAQTELAQLRASR